MSLHVGFVTVSALTLPVLQGIYPQPTFSNTDEGNTVAAPTALETILTRLRAGDATARPELYQLVYQQMRRIAGRILTQSFPALHNYHDVTSIVHDAWFNLDRALARVDLATEADFYAFVAHKVRQVLLTLIGKRQRRLPVSGEALANDSSAVLPVPEGAARLA